MPQTKYVREKSCSTGCHEPPHPLRTGPEIGTFWVLNLKQDCFRRTFSQCAIYCHWPMAHWQSTVLRAAAANRTSESDRQPTGLPWLRSTVAGYGASACITGINSFNWLNTSIRSFFFVPDRPIGSQSTCHTVNSSHRFFSDELTVMFSGSCEELTVCFRRCVMSWLLVWVCLKDDGTTGQATGHLAIDCPGKDYRIGTLSKVNNIIYCKNDVLAE